MVNIIMKLEIIYEKHIMLFQQTHHENVHAWNIRIKEAREYMQICVIPKDFVSIILLALMTE